MLPRLQAEHLALSWDGKPICRDISFDVMPGQIVALVGKSGTGKTTIFHALAGLTKPDSGHVLLDGADITGRAGKVSYMLQKDLLLEQHTIIDNVAMPLAIGGMAKREARAKAQAHFSEFGLSGQERSYPFQLSGGMRQRAALLRTYLMDNSVILMDEPFSALDAFTRAEMRGWFLETLASADMSFVLITHDVDEAIAMADRILVLVGNPSTGEPSGIIGAVDIGAPRNAREQFALGDGGMKAKREVMAMLDEDAGFERSEGFAPDFKSSRSRKAKARTPKYRDINEDDDGYHPYSDRQKSTPLFERDPWY